MAMRAKSLRCVFCGAEYGLGLLYACSRCEGSLEVCYDDDGSFKESFGGTERGIWKYRDLLPVAKDADLVTMGEGGTPLLGAGRLAEHLGHDPLYLKNETANPTLSFKDRPLSVALTRARELDVERVVTASTGNTGVAASAYASRAGVPCVVYVPAGTPREKTALMRLYGAVIREVSGSFSDAYEAARRVAGEEGSFNVTSTFLNPYAGEGDKTVAYELYEALGDAPDWVVVPVGAGPLLVYCFKGFRELFSAGMVTKLPRMVAVQAANCAPIVRAYELERPEVEPWGEPRTIATGIADPLTGYPRDGTRTLGVVRESQGFAVGIEEAAIGQWVARLARDEAICAEPAAALSVAAVERMKEARLLRPAERVVCVITGHGIKDLDSIIGDAK
jgi:threonine synthase